MSGKQAPEIVSLHQGTVLSAISRSNGKTVAVMGLIRLLTWLVIGYFLWAMVRNYLRKQEALRNKQATTKADSPVLIVKCRQCGLHLPQSDAVGSNDAWFCGEEHRRQWRAASQD